MRACGAFRRATGAAGSALVEILVATIIFVAVSAGLTSATINAKRTADSSRHAAEATTLALDKLEQLRTLQSGASDLTPGSHSDTAGVMNSTNTGSGIFTRTWTVTSPVASLSPVVTPGTVARVEMQVSWPTPNGGNGSVTLVNYLRQ
jgi:Tfp pilus assembly protein PilV